MGAKQSFGSCLLIARLGFFFKLTVLLNKTIQFLSGGGKAFEMFLFP